MSQPRKPRKKPHKVGDLVMAIENEELGIKVLGQISKVYCDPFVSTKKKIYRIMWLDGYSEDGDWEWESIEGFKQVLKDYMRDNGHLQRTFSR
jgi:hypothetical protein